MVRSNSFDLTQNRKKKSMLQHKVKDEDFSIIFYEDYDKIKNTNYNVSQLKAILKYHGFKMSGNKTQLKERLYDNLKGYFYAIKIQKNIRRKFVKLLFDYKGPGLIKRDNCNNPQDFYTLENLNDIHFKDFFSYKDIDGFIYGFTLYSISELLKTQNVKNPYNRQIISDEIYTSLNRIKKLSKIVILDIGTNDDKSNNTETVQSLEEINKNKLMELFQIIDTHGYITNINWFLDLDKAKIIHFMCHLKDIFFYRAELSREEQREIIPTNIAPFPVSIQYTFSNYSLNEARYEMLRVIEQFITLGINESTRSLGVLYVLGAFTLCSREAANAFQYLYITFGM